MSKNNTELKLEFRLKKLKRIYESLIYEDKN